MRGIVGTRALDLTLPEHATVDDLIEHLYTLHPRLKNFENRVLFGIGVDFVAGDRPLHDGETIAVMPPLQGG